MAGGPNPGLAAQIRIEWYNGNNLMTDPNRGRYWLAFLVLVGLLALYAQRRDLYGLYQDHRQGEARVQSLTRELGALEQKNASLERRVEQLDADPVELEAEIRRTKNHVREGETIYVVELPEDTSN